MSTMNIWSLLGIEPTGDQRTIKRAYTKLLKRTNPEDDPEGFQRLREAYERATLWAQSIAAEDPDPQEPIHQVTLGPIGLSHPPVPQYKNPHQIRQPHGQADGDFHTADQFEPTEDQPTQPTEPIPAPEDHPVVRHVLATAKNQGTQAAVEELQTLQNTPELEHLDRRDEFEEALLLQIVQAQDVPLDFVHEVSTHFGWGKHGGYMHRRHPQAIGEILQRISAWQFYLEHIANKQNKLASVLFGPYEPKRFALRALSCKYRLAMRDFMEDMEARYPDLLHLHTNSDSYTWWKNKLSQESPCWPSITQALIAFGVLAIVLYVSLIHLDAVPTSAATIPLALLVSTAVVTATALLIFYIKKLWRDRVSPALQRLEQQLTNHTFGRIFPKSVGAGLKFRHFVLALFLTPFTYLLLMTLLPEGQIKDEFLYTTTYVSALAILIFYFQLKSRSNSSPLISNAIALTGYYGWNIAGWIIGIGSLSAKNETSDIQISAVLALLICICWARNAIPHPKSVSVYIILLWASSIIAAFWYSRFPHADSLPSFALLLLLGILSIYTIRLGLRHVRFNK
jgi:hypothetical protein